MGGNGEGELSGMAVTRPQTNQKREQALCKAAPLTAKLLLYF